LRKIDLAVLHCLNANNLRRALPAFYAQKKKYIGMNVFFLHIFFQDCIIFPVFFIKTQKSINFNKIRPDFYNRHKNKKC